MAPAPWLTALFGCLAGYFLWAALLARFGRGTAAPDPVTSALHLLMSAAMIAMMWPGLPSAPIITITVFTAASLWFVYRALFGGGHNHDQHSGGNWYHAGMMGAMAVMAAVMAALSTPTGGTGQGEAAAAGMPGMAMPGTDPAGTTMIAPPPGYGWLLAVCWALGLAFCAAAAALAVAAIRRRAFRGWPAVESGTAVAMAVGMAVGFLDLR